MKLKADEWLEGFTLALDGDTYDDLHPAIWRTGIDGKTFSNPEDFAKEYLKRVMREMQQSSMVKVATSVRMFDQRLFAEQGLELLKQLEKEG